jgi:phosphatidylglycerol:prolipoprotein diacylglycerol transferase
LGGARCRDAGAARLRPRPISASVGGNYGRPTDLPWGVVFENGCLRPRRFTCGASSASPCPTSGGRDADRRPPTQLYETAAALAIWGVGLWLLRRQRRPGQRAGGVALPLFGLLAVERFLVELLRVKDDRFLGPLTLAQAISLAILVALPLLSTSRPAAATAPPPAR